MENENLYLAYKDFENSVGEKIRALLGDGETISMDYESSKRMADYFLPEGCQTMGWPAKTARRARWWHRFLPLRRLLLPFLKRVVRY